MEEPDKFRDECGVFGVYAPDEDVSRLTYFGLFSLQHRGQESAGIAVSDGSSILVFKDIGLVSQVFDENSLKSLQGNIAIGHVRYSTTGSNHWENAQPIHFSLGDKNFALAHNGNLTNSAELRLQLESRGFKFRSTSDSEIIAAAIAMSGEKEIEKAVLSAVKQLKGAFSLVIITEDKLIGLRDAFGVRPLSLGKLNGAGYVLSSETCGLNIVGAAHQYDVSPGHMVVIDDSGVRDFAHSTSKKRALCIFEFIYFARPDSYLLDKNLHEARREMGEFLAQIAPADADMVISVPDSGTPAAIGYARASGIPYGEGLIKNRYIGRTFINPSQIMRKLGIKLKLNPLEHVITGKRLVVVDDSIVRGNTSKKIVSLLREKGAKEVHFRISSPPVCWPCFYGIDTADQDQLIAHAHTVEEVRGFVGADSLSYLDLGGLIKSTGRPAKDFCMACFDGNYPIPVPENKKFAKQVLEA